MRSLIHHRTIGLLGGSFNPAHEGHVHVSREAMRRLRLNGIWWLVSPHNPLKRKEELGDYYTRLAQAKRMAGQARFIHVSEFEIKNGTRYTIDTLRLLKRRYPRVRFVWLMGADNLAQLHRWRRWREIADAAPMAVFDRFPFSHKALRSHASLGLVRHRLMERCLPLLAQISPPSWGFIHMRRDPRSATQLRKSLKNCRF